MLLRANILEFRSCDHVELDGLGPITALVGRNGAGKSNILRAVSWAARLATGSIGSERLAFYIADTGSVELQFTLDDKKFSYSVEARLKSERNKHPHLIIKETLCELNGNTRRTLLFKNVEGLRFSDPNEAEPNKDVVLADPTSSMLPVVTQIKSLEHAELFKKILHFLSGIRYYPFNELNHLDNSTDNRLLETREFVDWLNSSSRYSSSDAVMRILAMNLFQPDRYEELQQLLGSDGLNLVNEIQIRDFSPSPGVAPDGRLSFAGKILAPYYALYFKQGKSNFLSFGELSHGTRRVVDLIAAVLYDESTLMLIEHPEDAVHIGLLRKLIDLLTQYSSEVQVILATHSRAILNAMEIEQIRFVDMVDGRTRVHQLQDDALEQAERYISTEGPDGGSVADFVQTFEDTLL